MLTAQLGGLMQKIKTGPAFAGRFSHQVAKALELVEQYGASAVHHAESCTPLETAIIGELRARKLTNVTRLK